VDGVLAKALSRAPAERYASCGEFVEALELAFTGKAHAGEEITRIAPIIRKSARLTTRAASVARSSIAFIKGLVRRIATLSFGSQGSWSRARLAILAIVILVPSALLAWRWLATNSTQKAAMQAYDRGLQLTDTGRDADAIPLLDKAIGIRANFPEALMERGRVLYLHLHQTKAAINDFSAVIRLDPQHEWAYYSRGECYALLEQYDLAVADYDRALQLNPTNHFALAGRGIVFLKQKDYSKAIADFTEAIRINPHWDLAYHKRSEAKEAIGDAAGAKADLDQAYNLDSQSPR